MATATAEAKFDVIVAIDFGTTYSGFGYSFNLGVDKEGGTHVFRNWGRGQGLRMYKTPTCLLLTPTGDFHRFGHAAVETYAKQAVAKKESKDLLYFERFKLVLHKKQDLNEHTEVTAKNGKSWQALDVFAKSLSYLKDAAFDAVNGKFSKSKQENPDAKPQYEMDRIQWVVTVPAIWRPSAKLFMRQAAYKAGIASEDHADQLIIALEPEAASFYCRDLQMKDFIDEDGDESVRRSLKEHIPYMVIDNGGGTLDITVHELQHDGRIREMHCPSGGIFGGMQVDAAFEELMMNIFGKAPIRKFIDEFPNDWQRIMNEFEIQKRAEKEIDNHEICISLTINFLNSCEEGYEEKTNAKATRVYGANQVTVSSNGYLMINLETLATLYRPVVNKITDHIERVLRKEKLKNIELIFLVGGFSEALSLRQALAQKFTTKRFLTPQDPELAIIKGAVSYAKNPKALSSRVMGTTYGLGINTTFDPDIHPQSHKYIDKYDGKERCRDYFQVLAAEDERIEEGQTRIFSYFPLDPNSKVLNFPFYTSKNKNPVVTTDPCVRSENVQIELKSPDISKGRDRELKLFVYFGGTEIKVEAEDVESGNKQNANLRLLTKSN